MIKLTSTERGSYGRDIWVSATHVECVSTGDDGTTAVFGNSTTAIAYVREDAEYVVNAINETRGKMRGGGL